MCVCVCHALTYSDYPDARSGQELRRCRTSIRVITASSKSVDCVCVCVQLSKVVELLTNVISDTKGRIEKRQAQTYEEMLVRKHILLRTPLPLTPLNLHHTGSDSLHAVV